MRRWKRAALVLALIVVVIVILLRHARRVGPVAPPASPAGEEVVTVFFAGLAALQAGDLARAEEKLTALTNLAPGEMAGWANLGVLELRRGRLDEARTDLDKARAFAPASGEVEALLGLVESRAGKSQEAIGHFRKAVKLDPKDLESRYALASEIERASGPGAQDQACGTLEAILDLDPKNLPILLDRLRLAARLADKASMGRIATRLRSMEADWPEDARKRLGEVTQDSDPKGVATTAVILRNLLVRTPAFQRDLSRVAAPRDMLGREVEKLATMAMPPSSPADPDDRLTFTVKAGPPSDLADSAKASRGAKAVCRVDLDHDFRMDLVVAGESGLRLFRQTDDAKLEPMAVTGAPSEVATGSFWGVWAADVDSDGDLDLVLCASVGEPRVLRNNADGTFASISPFTGIDGASSFVWADFDGDGDPDAAIADRSGQLVLARNERGGAFVVVKDVGKVGSVAALTAAQVVGDASVDLAVLTGGGRLMAVASDDAAPDGWRSTPIASVLPKDAPPLSPGSARLFCEDVDNNGAGDWIVSASHETRVLLAGVEGPSRPRAALAPVPLFISDVEDADGDGLLDLMGFGSDGSPGMAMTSGSKGYHWLALQPRAQEVKGDQRINTFGIGGEVEIRAGLLWQKQPIAAPVCHFGLGQRAVVDVARIVWPNGSVQAEHDLRANATVIAEQRLKGSCPWLFAWNGRSMEFVKDILWSSPLGLRINAQDTAGVVQTEDRVKIDGSALVPRDGKLELSITAELWETHFFDHVELLVLDHPEGTEVFQDERFSVPPPPLSPVLLGGERPVAMARDQDDRDVTDLVRGKDGRYLGTFGKGVYQGVAGDHWVTIDLPEPAAKGRRLVAEGWTHPTDSSLNVAIGQGRHDPPRALSLEVPDGAGGWRASQAGLGFPAGKGKTMLVDLSGVAGVTRIRLRTNMEIYWDALWVADEIEPSKLSVTPLSADGAELRFRGFSRALAADALSPEVPRYQEIWTTRQLWRDLVGFYTRFGDVRELLARVDDRYVILNAGDEIALGFAAPAAPPRGMARDYAFVSDGWEKDGDLNTAFSKTVLPLPSHGDPDYRTMRDRLEDDPVYRRHPMDWEQYHTRYVTPEAFRESLRPRSEAKGHPAS